MTDTTNTPIQVLGEWTNDVATYEVIRDIAGRIAVRPKGRPEWPEWVEWRLDLYVALGWVSYDDGTPHWIAPKLPGQPKIVCLCGSGRFRKEFEEAEFVETLAGNIVLTIGCNTKDVARDIEWEHVKPMLDELHLKKIDLCDEVYVINPGGYIGKSTSAEITYAGKIGKPIRYLENDPRDRVFDQALTILGFGKEE